MVFEVKWAIRNLYTLSFLYFFNVFLFKTNFLRHYLALFHIKNNEKRKKILYEVLNKETCILFFLFFGLLVFDVFKLLLFN